MPGLVAVLAASAVLVAGCAAAPEAPRTATPTAATIAPLPVPSAQPGEVTRSTFGDGAPGEPAGAVPAAGALAVDVACSGTDGSTMTWSLVDGDDAPLGLSGVADCSGPASTSWLGITAAERPARLRVRLLPASGVVAGYAIVRSGTP